MNNIESEIIDSPLESNVLRRRKLLPVWIKVFIWIFMIFGGLVPVGILIGLLGYPFQMAFYGIETNDPISLAGVFLIIVFTIKGITALGLWLEKDGAILIGQIDAIIGIVACLIIMVYPLIDQDPGLKLNLRLELILLVPYLLKLNQIKEAWNNCTS